MVSCRQKYFLPETMGKSRLKRLLNRWKWLRPQLILLYIRLEQSWRSSNDDYFGCQSKSNPVSLLHLLFPLLVAPVIVCVGLFTEGRKIWTYGKVNTAKVLLWQTKLTVSVLSLLETEPRTREAIKERLKLGGRHFSQHACIEKWF